MNKQIKIKIEIINTWLFYIFNILWFSVAQGMFITCVIYGIYRFGWNFILFLIPALIIQAISFKLINELLNEIKSDIKDLNKGAINE